MGEFNTAGIFASVQVLVLFHYILSVRVVTDYIVLVTVRGFAVD